MTSHPSHASPTDQEARQRVSALQAMAVLDTPPEELPSLGSATEGVLLDYGVSDDALARVAARYVDKILRGAKPADLPVDLGSVFGFVLNLATAKALGLEIPPDILVQATDVLR